MRLRHSTGRRSGGCGHRRWDVHMMWRINRVVNAAIEGRSRSSPPPIEGWGLGVLPPIIGIEGRWGGSVRCSRRKEPPTIGIKS